MSTWIPTTPVRESLKDAFEQWFKTIPTPDSTCYCQIDEKHPQITEGLVIMLSDNLNEVEIKVLNEKLRYLADIPTQEQFQFALNANKKLQLVGGNCYRLDALRNCITFDFPTHNMRW